MIPWDDLRRPLLELFAELSGLQTVWIDKRRPFKSPKDQAWVLLRVRGARGIGIDDRRYRDTGEAAPAFPLRETANGHRRVSFDVRVESFRHDDDRFSFNAAEKIRTRLGWRSSLSRLLALNLSVIEKGQTLDVSGIVQDDRVTSVALFELVLNVGVCDENEITSVAAIETVEDPVGTYLPDP